MQELIRLLEKLLKDPKQAEPFARMVRAIAIGYAMNGEYNAVEIEYLLKSKPDKEADCETYINKFMENQLKLAHEIKEKRDIENASNN